jgi:ribose transport system substrate-binding protein
MSKISTKLAVAGATTLLLAACSSGSAGASTPAAGSSAGSSPLAAKLAQLEKAADSYPVPTGQISGVDGVKGKTVYYIPSLSRRRSSR